MKVVNPGMPEPYKYETDYRKIPNRYLQQNIPKGRGMIKWAPFATMPQQYETIRQFIKDQTKVDKPILEDTALNDLNNTLAEKIFYNPEATIKYWDKGYYKMIECEINKFDSEHNKFDSEHNKLEVIKDGEKVILNMDCIVEIE
ncbi:YolD-like family protein [Mammaliicoccus vitulinus]|uniref:YolD-like family protein n=1 Tax=Mammaliicoccus vitulinus TaxID=71237 RepID=UPI003B9E5B1E